jgi:hypothetical protein
MLPTGTQVPLQAQTPNDKSYPSDHENHSSALFYNSRRMNGLGVPSPSSTGTNTLQDLAVQTPVDTSPHSFSIDLIGNSYMLDSMPLQYSELHERRTPDSPRPFPVCTVSHFRLPAWNLTKTHTGTDHFLQCPPTDHMRLIRRALRAVLTVT